MPPAHAEDQDGGQFAPRSEAVESFFKLSLQESASHVEQVRRRSVFFKQRKKVASHVVPPALCQQQQVYRQFLSLSSEWEADASATSDALELLFGRDDERICPDESCLERFSNAFLRCLADEGPWRIGHLGCA